MTIQISQQYSRIGMDRKPSSLNIATRRAELEFQQKMAKINIQTDLPKVIINQYECFASAGLKNNGDLIRETAQNTQANVLEYIGKTAQDGKELAAIENGRNAIASIAKRDSAENHIFGLDFIPKVGPKIEVTGEVKLEAEPNSEGVNNGVDGTFLPASIQIDYSPAVVNIYLQQSNSIEINYVGNHINEVI